MVRAALIWARRLSSFKSFWRSPVTWAKSTISLPNWLKALTNSVKLFTPSRRVSVFDTYYWEKKTTQRLQYIHNIVYIRTKKHQLNILKNSHAIKSIAFLEFNADSSWIALNMRILKKTNKNVIIFKFFFGFVNRDFVCEFKVI